MYIVLVCNVFVCGQYEILYWAVDYPPCVYFYGYGINFISQRVTFLSFLNHSTDASGLPPVDKQDILSTFPDGIGSPDE